jgi:hypothetical protein
MPPRTPVAHLAANQVSIGSSPSPRKLSLPPSLLLGFLHSGRHLYLDSQRAHKLQTTPDSSATGLGWALAGDAGRKGLMNSAVCLVANGQCCVHLRNPPAPRAGEGTHQGGAVQIHPADSRARAEGEPDSIGLGSTWPAKPRAERPDTIPRKHLAHRVHVNAPGLSLTLLPAEPLTQSPSCPPPCRNTTMTAVLCARDSSERRCCRSPFPSCSKSWPPPASR